ncbi:MAG: RNA methyltransferase [Flavobacteriaceae bacterium]|nr:RNA methyltransferase [Flavobacteriaceae bacterium]
MQKEITSVKNPLVKGLLQLQEKSKVRKREKRFLIEGLREISLAVQGGYELEKVLVNTAIISLEEVVKIVGNERFELIEINDAVYRKLAFRDSTEGVIAVAKTKELTLDNLKITTEKPLFLVAEAPEKPGNIGALLRTADASGVDAVLIANPKTDMYNPNIVRSSVGCVFTTQIATGTTEEIIAFLKERNVAIYSASLKASVPYDTVDYQRATAIVVGTESTGLTEEWTENSTQNIIIPMRGKIDSMNVSVSAAVIIFEAVRQRNL